MHFSSLLALLPLAVSAANISIDVGEDGLVFSPNNVKANTGDQLVFSFYPIAHSVTQSTFAQPCKAMPGGINSGFVHVASGVGGTFTVTVNDTNPLWLYCAQNTGLHCQKGMVMVVNPPASGPNTLQAYTTAAAASGNSTIGTAVTGGMLVMNSTSSSGGNGTSPSGTASSGSGSSTASSTASAAPSASTGAAAMAGVAEWAVLGSAVVLGGLLI